MAVVSVRGLRNAIISSAWMCDARTRDIKFVVIVDVHKTKSVRTEIY